MLETLDHTIRIGRTPTFLYFDLYLYSAYGAHYVYNMNNVELASVNKVELVNMNNVELANMNNVELANMNNVELASMNNVVNNVFFSVIIAVIT